MLDFEYLAHKTWMSFEEYCKCEGYLIARDINLALKLREKLRRNLMKNEEFKNSLKHIDVNKLQKALDILMKGLVYGVDGSLVKYPTAVGIKARILISIVSYGEGGVEVKASYVSDTMLTHVDVSNPIEYIAKVEKLLRETGMIYKATMFFKEREYALQYAGKTGFTLVHGPLYPFTDKTLMLNVKGLVENIAELGLEIARKSNIIAVQSTTSRLRVINVGGILKVGEYIIFGSIKPILMKSLKTSYKTYKSIREAIEALSEKYIFGVYKAGLKPYIFYAPRSKLEEAVHILFADSIENRLKGFPTLLEYADLVSKTNMPPSAFKSRIESKLVEIAGIESIVDILERRLRQYE